jgi:hypothetical protein
MKTVKLWVLQKLKPFNSLTVIPLKNPTLTLLAYKMFSISLKTLCVHPEWISMFEDFWGPIYLSLQVVTLPMKSTKDLPTLSRFLL